MVLDNFRTIELIWDKANKSIIKTIKTASSDTTGRYFSVKVLDEGQEVDLTGAKLQLYWEHPNFNTNGTDDFTTIDTKGLFKLTFSDEMLTNVGELNAHLALTLPDGKITSDGFPIEVIKGADDGVVVPSNGKGLVKQIDGKIDKGNVTLSDLTQEVKTAMTGGSVAVVGVDAVGTENVKNNAITQPKLAETYTQNGNITTGRLSEYTRPGSYQVVYSTNITDLPANFKRSGHLFNAKSTGGWVIQLLSTVLGDPKLYYRTVRSDLGNITQVKDWILLNPTTIDRDRLSDSFMSDGIFLDNNTDLNTLYRDGLYVALSSVLNRPSDLDTTFFLEIKSYKNSANRTARWVVQDIYRFSDHEHLYTRRLDAEQAPKEWTKVDDNKLSTELNSKLQITQDRITELSERNPFKYAPFDKAYITIVWDDGRHDLDKVQEVYKDYPTIPMSLAIPSNVLLANNTLDGTTAKPKLQTVVNEILANPQNELLGHGKTGGAITANRTAEWVDDELGLAQVDYANLGYDVKGGMLSGATDPQGVYAASNYDDVGYGYIAKRYYAYGDNLAYDEPYNTKRTSIKSLADMQSMIDDAIVNKKWIAFFAHTMDGSEVNNTEANHRALLDYILGLEGIEFTTYRNMYEKFGSTELEQRLEKLEN